jgi:hypothetical protein
LDRIERRDRKDVCLPWARAGTRAMDEAQPRSFRFGAGFDYSAGLLW